jgi:peptidylprolyl isomerase
MRLQAAIFAMLMAGACTARVEPPPSLAAPATMTVKQVLEAAGPSLFKRIADEDVLVIELADGRKVTMQLAPRFAPVHVGNIRAFARAGFWDGATIYRVQDGFVVQWGRNDDGRKLPPGAVAKPPAEYELAVPEGEVVPLGYRDAFSDLPGFVDGWPVAYDRASGTAALPHCYGMVGAGRELAPDTGAAGELYAVIGHSPRGLDRNLAVVGRIIDGFSAMTALPRGTGDGLGMYTDKKMEVPIRRVRLAADLPAAERPAFEAMDTAHPMFTAYVRARANRKDEFYQRSAGAVDLCGAGVRVRKVGDK